MSTDKINSSCFFADRLAQLRGDRSRAEFARLIGVSAPLYFKWERGSIPGGDKLQLISQACDVSVEWLLTGSGEPPRKDSPVTPPSNKICHYPNGCDVEAELGQVKERLLALEGQLDTVIRLLGASLRVDDKQQPGRQAG